MDEWTELITVTHVPRLSCAVGNYAVQRLRDAVKAGQVDDATACEAELERTTAGTPERNHTAWR